MGPVKWSYFYLYVIIDIFSRGVVGWHIAGRESATLFPALFEDATAKHPAPPVEGFRRLKPALYRA
jgi:putative transposase